MFRYKMHYEDGSEAGDAADSVRLGDELMLGPDRFVRVLAVVAFGDDSDKYDALLKVEAA